VDPRLRSSSAHVIVTDLALPELDERDEHHLRRVLRLRDGEVVTVTDGIGAWRPCRLGGAGLDADGEIEYVPAPTQPVRLAVAVPKGDRLEWLIQKVTEIGIDRISLVRAERSVVRWDEDKAARHLERLARVVREAAMQSRRVHLPVLDAPVAASDVLTTVPAAEPGGRSLVSADHAIAIGPEGGWSPAELSSAATVDLGPHVLRVETAAVVAATLLVHTRDRSR
jgi:16S rRNA (uracil1498-N3)-methyltransferase